MVTVTLHSDRPRAAIKAWRWTFTGTRWHRISSRPVPVIGGDVRDPDTRQQAMLAHAELYGGSVTP